MVVHPSSPDFYDILGIRCDVSLDDIKIAYRRTLLCHHPDKQPRSPRSHELAWTARMTTPSVVDMALVKEAYETLSDARSRAVYDRSLKRGKLDAQPRPRPAQVVSLEEFTVVDMPSTEQPAESSAVRQKWHHQCRCGGMYRISEDDLENETHLVGCESCSEVIWVGYEVVTEDEESDVGKRYAASQGDEH